MGNRTIGVCVGQPKVHLFHLIDCQNQLTARLFKRDKALLDREIVRDQQLAKSLDKLSDAIDKNTSVMAQLEYKKAA